MKKFRRCSKALEMWRILNLFAFNRFAKSAFDGNARRKLDIWNKMTKCTDRIVGSEETRHKIIIELSGFRSGHHCGRFGIMGLQEGWLYKILQMGTKIYIKWTKKSRQIKLKLFYAVLYLQIVSFYLKNLCSTA